MNLENKAENQRPNRENRFIRTALVAIFALLAVLDAVLWYFESPPDNIVILVMLIPVLFAVFQAFQGHTNRALWIFTLSVWGAEIFLVLNNPQTPLEMDDLVGRYLFPIIFVIPIAAVVMKNKLQRNVIIFGSVFVSVGTAILGYVNDADGVGQLDPVYLAVINGLILIMGVGLILVIIKNFSTIGKWFYNLPLRPKLVGSFMTIFVVGVTALVSINLTNTTKKLESTKLNELIIMSESRATEIGLLLEGKYVALNTIALSKEMRSALEAQNQSYKGKSPDEILQEMVKLDSRWAEGTDSSTLVSTVLNHGFSKQLRAFQTIHTDFALLMVADKYGGLLAASARAGDYYQADEEWWQNSYNNAFGANYFSQFQYSKHSDTYGMTLAIPIYHATSREVLGVLYAALDIHGIISSIGNESTFSEATVEIVFSDGVFTSEGKVAEIDIQETPSWNLLEEQGRGSLSWNEEDHFAGIAPLTFDRIQGISELGWTVLTHVPDTVVTGPIRTQVRNVLLVSLATLIISIFPSYFLASQISNPAIELKEMAQKFSAGELDARVTPRSEDDEIGQLAHAFNDLADSVQASTVDLSERAREMEASQRVTFAASERTTPEDFLDLLVNLIVDQFDVYHSQIYLIDENNQNAVLSQSTGYAGRVLLQRNHRIPMEAESLVTSCLKTGEPVLVAETEKESGWLANPLLPYTKSELVIPIKVENQVIGALDIQARDEGRFTPDTVPVFESMIEQVAFLYQNNELLVNIEAAQQQQEEFVKQLASASEVAGQLTTILDPTQLLDQAVTMLQSRFNFYHAHIYLVDEAKEKLVVQSGSGHVGVILKDRGHSIPVDAEKSFVANAFRNGTTVRVADTTQDPSWLPNPLLPDTQSEMAVPLITRGQIIGVLDIQDEEVGRFTEVDADTMLTLAGQLATSVDTARLFTDVDQAAARTATRLEVTQALAGNLTEQEVLDVLVKKAGESATASVTLYYEDMTAEQRAIICQAEGLFDSEVGGFGVGFRISEDNLPFSDILPLDNNLIFDDMINDDRIDPAMKAALGSLNVVSLASFPIRMSDDWIGHLFITSSKKNFFNDENMTLYSILADTGTVALRSARLREQTESERERFETLVTYAPDAILMLNHETYMWEDANKNAEVMFGMSREELLKIGPGHVSPPNQPDGRESGEKAVDLIGKAVAGGNSQFEWVHIGADGNEFDCEIRLALLPGDEKQLLVNITDITNRKAAQDTIIEGDKLKSEFLANMSHELRTPLNSIVGYTDVLLMGIDGEMNDEMQLDVEAIKENSHLLLKIINDILDLAKIEAKRVIFELSEVEMKDVLENVVRNNAGLLVNKPVEMLVDVLPNLPKIEVDAQRVEQVLNNLVSNAVKFTDKGHITLRAFTEPDWMVLQVEDTGAGMNDEDLQVIFEEFRQADGSQTRTVEGTGLGLTITRRLVHMHSGTIEVASEFGKGSTFTVRLPLETKISHEVSVKEAKKVKKQAEKPVRETIKTEKPAKSEKAAKAKDTGSLKTDDLDKIAGMFGDELKKVVVSSNPEADPDEGAKTPAKKSSNSKNKNNSKKE